MKLKYDLDEWCRWDDLHVGQCFLAQDILYIADATGGRELLQPANHLVYEHNFGVQKIKWRVK